MPSLGSNVRPSQISAVLLAIVIIAGATTLRASDANRPASPEAIRLRALSGERERAKNVLRAREDLDARTRATLRALSARIRTLHEGPERTAAILEMSRVVRAHRIARLRLELDLARVRGDLGSVDRIGRILGRFERSSASTPGTGAARDPQRESAGR